MESVQNISIWHLLNYPQGRRSQLNIGGGGGGISSSLYVHTYVKHMYVKHARPMRALYC